MAMPSRAQVDELLKLGHTYESVARELGISPGLAFMIATGVPADGSGAMTPEELATRRVPNRSTQQLVNPPAVNPTSSDTVMRWVRERAASELERST
jgi:hypothetical protein